MVVGPAAVGMLGHDDALERPGSQRPVAHGVGQRLGATLAAHPGERQVVVLAAAEHEGAFLETVGQALHGLSAHEHRTAWRGVVFVAAGHLHLAERILQLQHVVAQAGTAQSHARPVDIGLTVVVDQHAGVDARHATNRLGLADERSHGAVGSGHADGKAKACLRGGGEVEVILAVGEATVGRRALPAHAVGGPHGVGVAPHPGHGVLGDDDAVVGPVGEVRRREDVVVGHAEPVGTLTGRRHDVVRRIQIHFAIEDTCRGVGRELMADNGILPRCRQDDKGKQQKRAGCSFHKLAV